MTSRFLHHLFACTALALLAAARPGLAQPTNDLCDNATPLPLGSSTTGTTVGATLDGGFPTPCGGQSISAPGVWFSLVGDGTTLTIETCTGTSFDSKLHVFCTTLAEPCAAPSALICIAGNDDACSLQSRISFCSASGQTYFVLVSGFGSAVGSFTLAALPGAPCTGSIGCAPPSTGACCTNTSGACAVTTSTACGSGSVYQGANTTCTPNPCPPVGSCCAAGGCCTIGPQASCTGAWTLAGSCLPNPCPGPINDACASAIVLSLGVPATGSNCSATDDQTVSCATTSAVNTHKTVWYTFTPAVSGAYTLNTCGSSFDTLLALYTGACGSLTEVACNDQSGAAGNTACPNSSLNSRIPVIQLAAGTPYRVLVGAWGVAPTGGNYTLLVAAVVPGACCNPTTAACSITSQSACAAPLTYRGDGTACTPTQCGASGACCAASGVCSQVNLTGCPPSSSYSGNGTVCAPNPCPQPGACCAASGCCVVAAQAACTEPLWISSAVCAPNPCPAPANDTCAGAQAVIAGTAATGSNCSARDDLPIACATQGAANTHQTVWFRFVPTHTAAYTLDTCGSSFDTILAVYGGACENPVLVACNDDSSAPGNQTCPTSGLNSRIRTVSLTAGASYLIELAGWGSFSPQGTYFLNIAATGTLGACCANGLCIQTDADNCAGSFQPGSCTPSPCPTGAGACCAGSSCAVLDAALCVGENHRFIGIGAACNAAGNSTTPCCAADFDQSGSVTLQDLFSFLNAYFASSPLADVNGGGVALQDIFDYLSAYFGGCV
ncbi:MAG: hypothetical protein IT438_06010 [Phycisphaerales bacterium]|nr:hypothetical protein [Phycisphaerales bacterium]